MFAYIYSKTLELSHIPQPQTGIFTTEQANTNFGAVDPRKHTILAELHDDLCRYQSKYNACEDVPTSDNFEISLAQRMTQALKCGATLIDIRNNLGFVSLHVDKAIAKVILDEKNEDNLNIKKFKFEAIYQFLTRENTLKNSEIEKFINRFQSLMETYINNDTANVFNLAEFRMKLTLHAPKTALGILDKLLEDEKNETTPQMCKFKISTLLKCKDSKEVYQQEAKLCQRIKKLTQKIIVNDLSFKPDEFKTLLGSHYAHYHDSVLQLLLNDLTLDNNVNIRLFKKNYLLQKLQNLNLVLATVAPKQIFFTQPNNKSFIESIVNLAKAYLQYGGKIQDIETTFKDMPWPINCGLRLKIESSIQVVIPNDEKKVGLQLKL